MKLKNYNFDSLLQMIFRFKSENPRPEQPSLKYVGPKKILRFFTEGALNKPNHCFAAVKTLLGDALVVVYYHSNSSI